MTGFFLLIKGREAPHFFEIDIYDDRNGNLFARSMPDGSIIQDKDPLTVPSTRRNPVLADIFNRLGYMERKGSGFGKIIGGYEFQNNYDESKKPSSFRSVLVPVYSCDAKFELQCPSECPSEKRKQSVGNSNIEYDKKG